MMKISFHDIQWQLATSVYMQFTFSTWLIVSSDSHASYKALNRLLQ